MNSRIGGMLLGFAAGVAATSLIFVWRSEHRTAQPASPPVETRSDAWGNSPFTGEAIDHPPETSSALTPQPEARPESARIPAAGQAAVGRAAPIAPATPATRSRDENGPWVESGQRVDAALPPEFAAIVENDRTHADSISQLHDDFNAERERSDWADATEQKLLDHLSRVGVLRGVVINGVTCRESLCQIQAVAITTNPGWVWTDLIHGMYGAPGLQIGQARWSMDAQNGQTYILAFIRKPPRAR